MRLRENNFLFNRPIAHRGLWGNGVAENSLSAFKAAAEKSIPIEIDLFLTRDNEIVCFHDDNLERMTGVNANIYDKTLAELKNLTLIGTEEKIPTLKEVLTVAEGKSPLLIEFKSQPRQKILTETAVNVLKNYKGEFAVQSFDPFILFKIKKLAPEFIRGVLGKHNHDSKSRLKNYVLRRMPFNFLIKPDFISYSFLGILGGFVKKEKSAPCLLAWTITDEATEKSCENFCDNIIYEGFTPEKYKDLID